MATHTLCPSMLPKGDDSEAESESEICGVEMSDGSTCERPAEECGYHA